MTQKQRCQWWKQWTHDKNNGFNDNNNEFHNENNDLDDENNDFNGQNNEFNDKSNDCVADLVISSMNKSNKKNMIFGNW